MLGIRPLLVCLLSVSLLAACGLFGGGEPSAVERLRQPPDLGADSSTAASTSPATPAPPQGDLLLDVEPAQLVVPFSLYDTWRRVGLAVDRLGFTLEDRNRAAGQYFVRYDPRADGSKPKKGFLQSLAFWRRDPDQLALYIIQLTQDGRQTAITVTDEDGAAAPPEVAERILTLLHEQLR